MEHQPQTIPGNGPRGDRVFDHIGMDYYRLHAIPKPLDYPACKRVNAADHCGIEFTVDDFEAYFCLADGEARGLLILDLSVALAPHCFCHISLASLLNGRFGRRHSVTGARGGLIPVC